MTDNNNNEANLDAVEPITDEVELQKYLTEQELLRSTKEALEAQGETVESAEDLLKKTAELTAEQMLSVDDSQLKPEQIAMKAEWRDAVLVMVIAEGVKKNFHDLLSDQGKGKAKNNNFTKGYMQALNDLYTKLMNIVPEEFKNFQSQVDIYDKENNDTATPDASAGTETAGESPEDGSASGEPTGGNG